MKYPGISTSQPYVSKVIIESAEDNQLRVIVRVALSSDRMFSPELRDSMTTSIVKVTDAGIIKELSRNNKSSNIELIENSRVEGQFGNRRLSIAEVKLLSRNSKESEKGFRIATQEFLVDQNIANLTFYVRCQYNLGHPRYNNLMSSENFKRKIVNDASIVAEDVFRNGQPVRESRIFVHSNLDNPIKDEQRDYSIVRGNKKVWTGPVHYHSSDNPGPNGYVGYMAGTPSHMGPKLKLVSSPNSTIHDYRTLERISKIPFNHRVREDQPLAHKRNAYFSNLCITSDRNSLIRMFFAVNMAEIIKNNAKLPRLIASSDKYFVNLNSGKAGFKDVSSLSIIKRISIQRERVTSSGKLLEGDNFIETIAESSQVGLKLTNSTTQALHIKNDDVNNMEVKNLGSIREIDNLFAGSTNQTTSNNIRYFTITDIAMSEKKDGIYKYSIRLDIEDGSVVYLKQLFDSLKSGLNAFEAYEGDFLNNPAHIDWPTTLQALKYLIKTIRSFDDYGGALIGDLEENLYMLSSPTTGTVESVAKVAELYKKITFMVQQMAEEELTSRGKEKLENMNPKTTASGNRTFPLLITINHSFSDFHNAKDNEAGYDYFSSTGANAPGLLTISHEDYLLRAKQETSRYFNNEAIDSLQLNSLEYSYLTPTMLKLKDRIFVTHVYNKGTKVVTNNTELSNFYALMSLFNYKKHGKVITETQQVSIEEQKSKMHNCNVENLFSQKLSSFSTHVKNNLSNAMLDINALGMLKHESSCLSNTDKEEADYAKLMMPTSTSDRYKSELPAKDIRETYVREETGDSLNLSSIFAPLFYMHYLNISKDICCCVEALNTVATNNLPNQLKAMTLSHNNMTTHTWYDDNSKTSLKTLGNAAFHYLNNKNLVAIEVLTGFTRGMINAPTWVELKKEHINLAAESRKPMLLCRMRHYVNEDICFYQNELLNLNIFNQCFLLDASQVAVRQDKIARRIQPIDKMTLLDKNDFLKLESNFMKTNLKFGQVVKQIVSKEKAKRKTQQTTQTEGETAAISATTPTPTMAATISPGGTSGGGGY